MSSPEPSAEGGAAIVTELNLILLGPPGAGKGTQAERLTDEFELPYFATGNILRAAVKDRTPVGIDAKRYMDAGELVPDEVIIGVLLDALRSEAAAGGFLLDGFPRTVPQADALGVALEKEARDLSAVILIDVDDEVVVQRISGRRMCAEGHVFHVDFNPAKVEGVCDICGAALQQRADDEPETVRNRLAVYHASTEPLVGYYDERGLLRRIDGALSPAEVYAHIRALLQTLRREDEL